MKSFESVINNSLRFAAVSFAVIDDTKVRQVASIVKDKKASLLIYFFAFLGILKINSLIINVLYFKFCWIK
jgi:hypothetical protein